MIGDEGYCEKAEISLAGPGSYHVEWREGLEKVHESSEKNADGKGQAIRKFFPSAYRTYPAKKRSLKRKESIARGLMD